MGRALGGEFVSKTKMTFHVKTNSFAGRGLIKHSLLMRHPNNIFTNQLLAKEAVWVYARALLLKPITAYANNTYL